MADKKISELPLLNSVSGSAIIVPMVHDGTTIKLNLSQLAHYSSQWSAKTGSANTFTGNQTINGNLSVSGKITVNELVAVYETASVVFSSGSNIFGDAVNDIHQFTGSVDINGTLILNGSAVGLAQINAFTQSVESQLSKVYNATSSLQQFTASQDARNFVISQYTSSTDAHIVGIAAFTSSQLAVNLGNSIYTASVDSHIVGISTYTSSVRDTLARIHQATASIQATTASINSFTSSTNAHIVGISEFTSSQLAVNLGNAVYTSSVNNHIVGISAFTSSQLAVNFGISLVTASLIGITNTLMGFTASLDNTYATDAQLYQLYQATHSIELTTGSLIGITNGLMAYTSSNETWKTDVRGELNGIEAYTASLKAVAIVSSSTQISNYYKFAETASASTTFYGNVISNGNVQANKFVFTDGVVSQNVGGQNIIGTSGNILYLYTGTSGLYINNQANNAQNVTITDAGVVTTRGGVQIGAPGNDQSLTFGGTNSSIYWGSGGPARMYYNVGDIKISSNGATDVLNVQNIGGILVSGGITGSLMATNGVVSSSQQISNYYKFAETASANTFYNSQTISGSLLTNGNTFISGNLTISGSINSVKYVDFPQWDSTTQPGRLSYDTGEGTLTFGLSGGNLDLPIGVVNFENVYNEDSSSISKGQAVRVTGAQGNRVAVKKAHALDDDGSAEILGLAVEAISAGAEGKIITSGPLKGVDTSAYTEGQKVYLSTTAGGITVEKPQAPVHMVWLGTIQRVHGSVGIINVKVQNGYEIEELHDVRITTASLADKQLLARSGSVWANQTISHLGIAETASVNPIMAYTASLKNAFTIDANNDVYFVGKITTQELHTTYTTSSVLFQSGSTKLGNSSDDKHEVTGSLNTSFGGNGGLFINDGFQKTFTFATGNLFSIDFGSAEGGGFIDVTYGGVVTTIGGRGGATRYAISYKDANNAVATKIHGYGDDIVSASISDTKVAIFSIAGDAVQAAKYQVNVNVNAVAADGSGNYDKILYNRL